MGKVGFLSVDKGRHERMFSIMAVWGTGILISYHMKVGSLIHYHPRTGPWTPDERSLTDSEGLGYALKESDGPASKPRENCHWHSVFRKRFRCKHFESCLELFSAKICL